MRAGIIGRAVVAVALLVGTSHPLSGQGITQQQAEEILKELRAIRQALERLGGPPPAARAQAPPSDQKVKLSKLGGFTLGRPDAPLTMIEFTDLQCPFCSRFTSTTFGRIKTAYIDTGLLRFISRDFPLDMHPYAERAARASRCAGDQGRFWELRSTLVLNTPKLSPEFILSSAEALGLDMKAFRECLDSNRYEAEVRNDREEGAAVGVEGTPTFLLGPTQADGFEGVRIVGAQPFEAFDAKIKQLLGQVRPTTR